MKRLWILLGAAFAVPLTHAGAANLTADEIVSRMRTQAESQVRVNGMLQGVGNGGPGISNGASALDSKQPPPEKTNALPVGNTAGAYPRARQIDLRILFEFSSPKLAPIAESQLRELCEAFRLASDIQKPFSIIGHTDAVGNEAANLKLSIQRAETVRQYLIERCDIAPERLKADGKGESDLRPGLNPRDPMNRRVEVKISQ